MRLRIAKKVWLRLISGWHYPHKTILAMQRRTTVKQRTEWRITSRNIDRYVRRSEWRNFIRDKL